MDFIFKFSVVFVGKWLKFICLFMNFCKYDRFCFIKIWWILSFLYMFWVDCVYLLIKFVILLYWLSICFLFMFFMYEVFLINVILY